LKLVDTHAHLDEIKDIEGALARAKEAGIRAIAGIGTDHLRMRKFWSWPANIPWQWLIKLS
jgi:Tat protein secretion system quality control protein TatD with DNase activity